MNLIELLILVSLALSGFFCKSLFVGAYKGYLDATKTLPEAIRKADKSQYWRYEVAEQGFVSILLMFLGPLIPMLILATFIFFILFWIAKSII